MSPRRPSARRSPSLLVDMTPPRLFIFVPALMSVGFVFWLSALVRDQLDRRRVHTIERRAEEAGRASAAIVRGTPSTPAASSPSDYRRLNLLAAVLFGGLSLYVAIGAIGNYTRPDGYVHDIGWLLALSLVVAASFAGIGIAFAMVSLQWPHLSPRARRIVARTPIAPGPPGGSGARPSERLTGTFVVTAGIAAVFAMLVGSSRGFLSRLDEPLLDAATDAEWLGTLSRLDLLGSSLFVVVAAALLGIASLRCRALVIAYPVAVAVAFVIGNLLRVLVERGRPPEGPYGGSFDSFPSGHLIMVTILAGLLPLTLAVMSHSTRLVRATRVLAAVAVVLAAAHRIHSEAHWPSDAIGGVLIGASIVLAVEWAIAHEDWHRRCRSCPWAPDPDAAAIRGGTVPMHLDTARVLGWSSHLAAAGVAVALAALSFTRGIPSDPEGILLDRAVQRPLQLGLAGVVSVGALVSWRWPPVGAVLLAMAGAGLGVLASLQYEPTIALAMTAIVLVPAVLLWLSWQHRRPPGEIAALAGVTLAVLATSWVGASIVYASIFGPTHPDSVVERVAVDRVEWVWLGNLGAETISVTARLDDDHTARLLVMLGDETWHSPVQMPTEADVVRFDIDGLRPDETYEYVIEVDGRPDRGRGRGTFRTPAAGPASFRLVAASCARVDSNGAVFDAMAAEDPLLYLALGDLHYGNISENDVDAFRVAYDRMLTQPGPAALYRDVPVSYVWDDHDYGPNDSDAASPSRDAAREAFRGSVPSHPLVSDDGAIHRAYTIGRVRFVVTDNRSERSDGSMLGAEQLAWLEDELVSASRSHALIIWMNSTPWIGAASPSGDGWSGFAEERRHIADTLAQAEVDNLLMVSGDAHMLAFDDGTDSGYATDGSPGFPVFHAAALDRPGNVKGGPYSGGALPGFGQYGVIDIRDDGETIEVELTGKNWKGEVLLSAQLEWS